MSGGGGTAEWKDIVTMLTECDAHVRVTKRSVMVYRGERCCPLAKGKPNDRNPEVPMYELRKLITHLELPRDVVMRHFPDIRV